MTDLRKAAEMALEVTPHEVLMDELMDANVPKTEREHAAVKEIEALRQALAQPEQEPVAWLYDFDLGDELVKDWTTLDLKHLPETANNIRPLYTAPISEPVKERISEPVENLASISRCKLCGGALPVTGALDRTGECDCIGQLKVISTIAWFNAPIKTEWGEDMMCASVFIDNNHTLTLYCERSQIHKVPNIIKEQA